MIIETAVKTGYLSPYLFFFLMPFSLDSETRYTIYSSKSPRTIQAGSQTNAYVTRVGKKMKDFFCLSTGQADESLAVYALVLQCKLLKWQFLKFQLLLLASLVCAPLTCFVVTIYEPSQQTPGFNFSPN